MEEKKSDECSLCKAVEIAEKLGEKIDKLKEDFVKRQLDDVWGDNDNINIESKPKELSKGDPNDFLDSIDDAFDRVISHREITALDRAKEQQSKSK